MIIFKKLNYKINYKFWPALSLISSAIIVSFGQPARSIFLSILSSLLGFALFWVGLDAFQKKWPRFWTSLVWAVCVESIQLSWMTSVEYQGASMYGVYIFVSFMIAAQFALLNTLILPRDPLPCKKMLFLASFWVLMEWSRLFFICGFPFNPVGLSFSASILGMQSASVAGVYGLSFLVILTNLASYRFYRYPQKKLMFIALATFPYLFGGLHYAYHQHKLSRQNEPQLRALLIQTALNPPEKVGFGGYHRMCPPIDQWGLIFEHIAKVDFKEVDLIALPERALPLSNNTLFYSLRNVCNLIEYYFQDRGLMAMPPLDSEQKYVDNMFLAQTLANLFQTQVVIGLEQVEPQNNQEILAFAAAYSFQPNKPPEIYHKQILIPLVEYLPFQWCQKLAERFGIDGWYQPGDQPMIYSGKFRIAPSICMEEMYSYIVHRARRKGAEFLLNISNDAWYPNSKLTRQHFDHGRLRGIENGVPVLRACNTGITGAWDALGQECGSLKKAGQYIERQRGALYVEVPAYHHLTLYSFWGDYFIVSFSFLCILNFSMQAIFQRKSRRLRSRQFLFNK